MRSRLERWIASGCEIWYWPSGSGSTASQHAHAPVGPPKPPLPLNWAVRRHWACTVASMVDDGRQGSWKRPATGRPRSQRQHSPYASSFSQPARVHVPTPPTVLSNAGQFRASSALAWAGDERVHCGPTRPIPCPFRRPAAIRDNRESVGAWGSEYSVLSPPAGIRQNFSLVNQKDFALPPPVCSSIPISSFRGRRGTGPVLGSLHYVGPPLETLLGWRAFDIAHSGFPFLSMVLV